MEKTWFELSFQDKLLVAHRAVLFPDEFDKNSRDFLSMVIARLIDKVDGLSDDEIDNLFE